MGTNENHGKLKNKIIKILNFIKTKQIGVMLSLMMIFLCFVMFSWGCAFWLNGLYEYKFDLGSCWQGITVVATGLVTVASFAAMPFVKLWIDSKYNSKEGDMPDEANPQLPSVTQVTEIAKAVIPKK